MNASPPAQTRDLARITLVMLIIGLLIAGSLWVVKPFLPALVWASMIVVATWPILEKLDAWLGGRRTPAATIMTLALLLLIVVPLTLAIMTLVGHASDLKESAKTLTALQVPPPPAWVDRVPLVGHRISWEWQLAAHKGLGGLAAKLSPYAGIFTGWVVARAGSLGMLVLHFLLMLVMAAILYGSGETAARWVIRLARRLSGNQGEKLVRLAAQSVRAVALGIVVTALVQSLIGGIGLAVAGIPFVPVLVSLMLMLCLAQIGPLPVLLPAVGWLFWSGQTGWAVFLMVCAVTAASLDNLLRPYLIRKGANLPLALILTGVIGGLLAFGIVGLFVGPVLLAISYTLLNDWIRGAEENTLSEPTTP